MKVAINRCYGGFGLSDKAIEMIMSRKGLKCYRYIQTKTHWRDGVNEYIKVFNDSQKGILGLVHYYTKDLGDVIYELPREDYWYYSTKLKRTDEDLISVVEQLGDKANGLNSNIHIIDIPDDTIWQIRDYDGMERIEGIHGSWF